MGYKTLIVKRKNETGKRWLWHVWANGVRIIAHSDRKSANDHVKMLRRWK